MVAESFATIFYRNCVNIGLPLLEIPEITKHVEDGDEIKVNMESGELENVTKGKTIKGKKLEKFLFDKISKGGLIPELQAFVKEHHLDQ